MLPRLETVVIFVLANDIAQMFVRLGKLISKDIRVEWNAAPPIPVIDCGKLVNEHWVHPLNACEPIYVSVSGRVHDLRLSHCEKEDASLFIELSHEPSGIEVIFPRFSILVIPLLENALLLIFVRFGTFREKVSSKEPTLKNA